MHGGDRARLASRRLQYAFCAAREIQPSGLNGKVRMRVASESELELWIDYGIAFRSVRELQAGKK